MLASEVQPVDGFLQRFRKMVTLSAEAKQTEMIVVIVGATDRSGVPGAVELEVRNLQSCRQLAPEVVSALHSEV